jgi:hypothetical protein
MLNLETIGGTASSALICTRPHWGRCGVGLYETGIWNFSTIAAAATALWCLSPTVAFY